LAVAATAPPRITPFEATALAIVAGISLAAFWTMGRTSYDVWGGVVVAVVLVVVDVPLLRRAAQRIGNPSVAAMLPWAFGVKLAASIVRYAVVFAVYDGNADASTYHDAGLELYRAYRDLNFTVPVVGPPGTIVMRQATAAVYAVTGPTQIGGFLVFAAAGFWGAWLFVKAFATACPEGDLRRYAALVLFLPSILFWPASIGKEAWMTLALGLAAYGAALLLTRHRRGLWFLGAGLLMANVIRPHVAGLVLVGVAVAALLRRNPGRGSILAPLAKVGGIVVLGLMSVVVVNSAERVLGIDTFNSEAVSTTLERAERQTSGGGSAFDANTPRTDLSPTRFPSALTGVLFRPYPWEASNPLALAASAEGVFLFALFVRRRRNLVGAVRSILRTPYVLFCVTYSILFVYGFSAFANFGVLTRQRVQVFPFILVLVCVPPFRRREQGGWRSLLLDRPEEVPA
jgi:hypothetical protein